MTPWKLELVERRQRAICQTMPDYDVVLNGAVVAKCYHNMSGYCIDRGLPTPRGSRLDPGEISLAKMRREVSTLNREAKAIG